MKKIKLKKNKKIKKANFIVIIIILIIITLFMILKAISNYVNPIIMDYANTQAKKVATLVIVQAVNDEINNNLDNTELFKSSDNVIDFNPVVLNKTLGAISKNVRTYLKDLEAGKVENLNLSDNSYFNVDKEKLKSGIIYQVPTGIIFNNGLLANVGPKIPVKLSLIGDITLDIKTNIKDYGINNAVIQVSVNIKVTEKVILPFSFNKVTVEMDVPIAIKIINGDIPNYYITGDSNKSLVVPIENN